MAEDATDTPNLDYTSGAPRRHHSRYIDDGNIVIQVEKAIFKVHRYFLARYSTVLQGMFDAPQQDGKVDGTDESPLVLAQDSAVGWGLLLDAIYDSHSLGGLRNPSGEDMLVILPIAHKYCMDEFETAILERLEKAHTTETFVNLMVASRIVDSQPLYQQALYGLISCTPRPDLSQTKRIGVEAHYEIMEAALSAANDATSSAESAISSLAAAVEAQKSALSTAKVEASKLRAELAHVKAELVHARIMNCGRCGSGTDWRCMSRSCIQMRSQSKSKEKPVRRE